MDSLFNKLIAYFARLGSRVARRRKVVVVVAAVVAFATAYALVMPAVTLDKNSASEQLGMDVSAASSDAESEQADAARGEDEGAAAGDATGDSQAGGAVEATPEDETQAEGETSGAEDERAVATSEQAAAGTTAGQVTDGTDQDDADKEEEPVPNEQDVVESAAVRAVAKASTSEQKADDAQSAETATTDEGQDATGTAVEEPEEPAATETFDDEGQEGQYTGGTLTAENGSYKVTLTYDEAAQLPEGARLRVATVGEGSDAYDAARSAVVAARQAEDDGFDEAALGLAALDISIVDASGNEVEPNANVKVEVEAKALPQEAAASGVDVQHIVSADKVEDDTPATDEGKVAQTVATGVQADGGDDGATATASFEVGSFSVFTITWKNTSGIRFANVRIHYVDENGLELADPTTVPASQLGDAGVVDLATWAYETDDGENVTSSSRISGYGFERAQIGSRTGTTVTGLKAEAATSGETSTYALYYTADVTVAVGSSWTRYTDATSGTASNNADVYLVYKQAEAAPLTFHYLALDGTPLKDGDGNEITKTIDASTLSNPTDVASWLGTSGNTPNGYSVKAADGGYNNPNPLLTSRFTTQIVTGNMQSSSNAYFRSIKYDKDPSDGKYYVYAGRGAGTGATWETPGKLTCDDPSLYVTLQPANSLAVTVHRVDTSGNAIADDVTYTLNNGNSVSLTDGQLAVSGYTVASGYYDWTSSSNTGTAFATMTYRQGEQRTSGTTNLNTQWKSSYKADASSADATDTENLETELWVVYDVDISTTVTVHHLNEQGAEIHDATTKTVQNGGEISASGASESIDGYALSKGYFGYTNISTPGTEFSSLAYTYDADTKTWSTTYKTSESDTGTATSSAVADVYLVYTHSNLGKLTIHHVDTSGVRLANDTEYTANTLAVTDTNFAYKDRWNGFSKFLDGSNATTSIPSATYLKSYIGYFGDEDYSNVSGNTTYTALSFKYDSFAAKWHTGVSNSATGDPSIEYHAKGSSSDPVLLTDVYTVYGGVKGLVVHHVDESGNAIATDTYTSVTSGGSIGYSALASGDVDGYALKDAHLASYNGQSFTKLTYTYDDNAATWSTSYTYVDGDDAKMITASSPVSEVWLVYASGGATKTITGHYVYMDANGDAQSTNTAEKSFSISTASRTVSGMGQGGNPQYVLKGDGVNTTGNDDFFGGTVKSSDGNTTLAFVTTRVGSATGPEVTYVKLGIDGQLYYLTGSSPTSEGNASTTIELARQGGRNVWTYAADSRTYTLTRDSEGNLSLSDSLSGRFDLNLTSTDASGVGTYTATYQGADHVTQYSVKLSSVGAANETNYTLTVEEWIPSTSTDLYFIYEDASNEISIDNDLIFSGRLKVARSASLITDMKDSTNEVYTWYKLVTTDPTKTASTLTDEDWVSATEVVRNQNGTDWNLAYAQSSRTWLDVAADDGARTASDKVFYRVKVSYTNISSEAKSYTSDPVEIEYYGQLENGSYETPQYMSAINQVTNKEYRDANGVWQSTGTGTEPGLNNKMVNIEIVNTTADSNSDGTPDFISSYAWNANGTAQYAQDGNQFAELNCSAAGALYQDVITHPNEQLSYWFSHRARGQNNDSTPEYDTMYLVIMPTSLAMTSGAGGMELTSQADLIAFIQSHGGMSYDTATSEEDKVTYYDSENGILVRRVSSDDQDWQTISATNGYLATDSLTRFFFVAGPTSWNGAGIQYPAEHGSYEAVLNATHGNFLDNVGFSQELPTPTGFNLTVTKTISGLTSTQIASLASNAKNVEGTNLSNGKTDHFKITLSDKHVDLTGNMEDNATPNNALNGAVLEFTASGSGGSYTFTPTAVDSGGNDLLTGSSTGTSRVNADGSVTLTWTFVDQQIDSEGTDQTYNYTAVESGETVSGLAVNSDSSFSPESYINSKAVEIQHGTSGTIAFSNTYSRHRDNDQPQITVSKTFSGVTPTTVSALWSGGYTLSVKNSKGTTAQLSAYDDQLSANATLVSTTTNDDGTMTYVWSISGTDWGAGTYTVTEGNFRTDSNTLTKITVNGEDATPSDSTTNLVSKDGVTISDGTAAAGLLAYSTDSNVVTSSNSITSGNAVTLPEGTNIIIGKFTTGDNHIGYLVWTSSPLGRQTSNAVVEKIKTQFGDQSASLGSGASDHTVYFRNGNNPGTITSDGATLTYDSSARSLTFTNVADTQTPANNRTWNAYYSTSYSVANDSSAYDVQDIKVANVYNPVVKVKKVSNGFDGDALQGAKFRVYKLDGSGNRLYYLSASTTAEAEFAAVSSVDGNTASDRVGSGASRSGETKALSFQTGDDGMVEIGALPKGTDGAAQVYYLEEYEAPLGYNRVDDLAFVVKADGSVQLVSGSDYVASTSVAKVTFPDPYYQITVVDIAGLALPITGGMGTALFALVGAALVAAAGVGYVLRRRREEGGAS